MSKIELQGLTKPEALAALFNAAKPQGLGELQYDPSHRMDSVEAAIVLTQGMYVDYLEGRVIKTDFGKYSDAIDTTLYDQDNGKDAGGMAIWRAAGRKNLGDFRGDLKLPPEIGGCKCQRVERPDVHYEYCGFMGKMLMARGKNMIKWGGLLLVLAGFVMPYTNNFEYAIGGVLIFVGAMIFLNAKGK